MPSQDFEQFYESCFGETFAVIHNGVNEAAILNLQGDERREAERLLLLALGTDKDTYSRTVTALGLLGSKDAVAPLKQRLNKAVGRDRIETALALFRIEKFPESGNVIIDCLQINDTSKPDENTRMLAVMVLPFLGRTPQVIQALVEAMAEDNPVGYAATGSLRKLFIEDEPIRNILGQILLIVHDIHKLDFVSRPKLVKQAEEMITAHMGR
jgi:HEAT repeat protein